MRSKKTTRIAIGTTCLIVVALVMGWFAGRYIPGEPEEPAASTSDVLAFSSGHVATHAVDFAGGSTMKLPSLLQGDAYEINEEHLDESLIESSKFFGAWERRLPSLDVAAKEVRTVSAQSFADYNPGYYDWRKVLDDGTMVLVTAELANTSDEPYSTWWHTLPTFTLWNDALANGDDAMGAGIALDIQALYLLNPTSIPSDAGETPPLLDIAPGESQQIVLPFRVTRNALANPAAFDGLDPSSFCLQTADYGTATVYRLWL